MSAENDKIGVATASQLNAADPTRSVWVSANAGTGKTRVLVDRIARLLLAGCAPQKILCLTFTKTAAAEMAARINARLGSWVVMGDKDLKAELTALSTREPDEQTMALARTLFARVLETPGGLKIRTIHSFAESMLARFPLEAGVAPHFSVIDERSAAELMHDAQLNVLEGIYFEQKKKQGKTKSSPASPLPKAMSHLAELVNEENFAKLIRELIGARANLSHLLDTHANNLEQNIAAMAGLQDGQITTPQIIKQACKDESFDKGALERAAIALSHGAKTSKESGVIISAWLNAKQSGRADMFVSDYKSVFVKKDGGAKAEKTLITKGAKEFDPDALAILLTEQTSVLEILDKIKCAQSVAATCALLRVGRGILDEYEKLKSNTGVLDYDDLIEKACSLLTEQSNSSWVHFKLDGGIDHILVDESQDTSPEQWTIVKGLAMDFFSGTGQHEETERTVFAVGDEKQSIYSFQGADPYEFGRMSRYFESKALAAERQFISLQLITSFRSTNAVLRIVDKVFQNPVAFDGLSFDDKEVLHKSHRQGEAGLVELWPIETPEQAIETDPWDAPLDRLSIKSPETKLAERIATTISGWLKNNEILKSKGRPIRSDDILILVRRRGAFADEMVRQLKLNKVAVAGSDRMVLTDQIAVEDLMALGNFCLLPEDDLNTATVLKSPLIGMNEDQLLQLAAERKTTIWAALKKLNKEPGIYQNAFEILRSHLARADYQPPFEFFAHVLNKGGRKQLIARLGSDAEDPLDEFLSLSLQFERNHTPSLQGFLHWVSSGGTEIKRDMEITGAKVRVMTVHGAKGLEANIVFLPDTCAKPAHQHDAKIHWRISDDNKPTVLWSPVKEMRPQLVDGLIEKSRGQREREYRRLLYVAMTRARDRLYICGYGTEEKANEGTWYDLIEPVLKDRGTECKSTHGMVWTFEPDKQVEVEKKPLEIETSMTPLPGWAATPPGAEKSPSRPLAPSMIENTGDGLGPFDDEFSENEKSRQHGFARGLAVHKLLEVLPSVLAANRELAGKHWLTQAGLGLEQSVLDEILHETMAVLENKELAPLFSPAAMVEAPIIGRVGKNVISGRIDRLVVEQDEVLIIDFKTNRVAPVDAGDIHPTYLSQMAIYKTLLRDVYPDKRIRTFLLWTRGARAMEIPPKLLDNLNLS